MWLKKDTFLSFKIIISTIFSFMGLLGSKVQSLSVETKAEVTSVDVRISVIRSDWWANCGFKQLFRTADSEEKLNNNEPDFVLDGYNDHVSDEYYQYHEEEGEEGFRQYGTEGVVFFDVPFAELEDKKDRYRSTRSRRTYLLF